MPNRILSDSLRLNPGIDRLGWFEEVFYYRLLMSVDDYGCMDGRPTVLRSTLFPTREDISSEQAAKAVAQLEASGLLLRYEAEGQPYLALTDWGRQRIRNKRRKYPQPPSVLTVECPSDDGSESESESNTESNTESESESRRAGGGTEMMRRLREEFPELKNADSFPAELYLSRGLGEETLREAAAHARAYGGRSWKYVSVILNNRLKGGPPEGPAPSGPALGYQQRPVPADGYRDLLIPLDGSLS